MKIAFHIHSLTKGGAERAVTNLANEFSSIGHEVFVITSIKNESEYKLKKEVTRIVLHDGDNKDSYWFRYVILSKKLRKVCNNYKFDVLIPFISGSSFRAFLATRGMTTKVIASVRNDPNYEYAGIIGNIIGKKILPLVDGCVFQTNDAKRWFPNKLQEKSVIIPNAINPIFFDAIRHPKFNRVVAFGRLAKQKNHAMLIRAFALVKNEIPEAELLIFGIGNLYNETKQLIEQLKLQECVFLMGETANVKGELEKADLFVLSSDFEGMPNALMEAMAAGTPCVSTDCPCGGPKSLIKDKENGILVPIKDIEKMAEAIKCTLINRSLNEKIGRQAAMSSKELTSENISNKWIHYIESIIN